MPGAPNKAMELTSEIVTPFACAKGVTISAAAHRWRYTTHRGYRACRAEP